MKKTDAVRRLAVLSLLIAVGVIISPILRVEGPWTPFQMFSWGIIGAIASYPVMTFLWGREGLSWLFYVPSFICGTLIGGSIAYVFLRKLAANGVLAKMQRSLGAVSYRDQSSILSDSLTVAALGAILWVMLKLAAAVFALTSPVWNVLANVVPAAAAAAGLIYYMVRKGRDTDAEAQ